MGTYLLANTPATNTLALYWHGVRLTPGAGNDYTLTGATITTTLPVTDGLLLADYQH